MTVGMQTMMLNKQQQLGSPNWWWLDPHNNNNNNNRDATRRSPWLQSTLSELDEKTASMLKLIEADADSFAQRAEMYYRKRPDLIAVVEEFYRMHRSLAERFDQLKSDSAKRLKTLGSPFSCNEQQVPPLKKSLLLSPGMYKCCDTCSDTSDDHEVNPESEVEDPGEDTVTEPTSPKDKSGGKPVALDMEALTQGDGNYEIRKLKVEIMRLREENRTLRDKMARKDAENMQGLGRLSISMYEIARQRDEMACHEEQKVEMVRELTMLTGEIKRLKEQNDYRRCEVACFDKLSEALNEIVRLDEKSEMQRSGTSWKDEGKKREATRPLSAAPMDVPKEEENDPVQKKQAQPNLGKSSDPVEPNKIQRWRFLRRLFPKSSKKSKATSALSFGIFH